MKRRFSFVLLLALMLSIFGVGYAQTTVTIGEGTSSQQYPFHSWYGFGRSLSLYTYDQIGSLGNITSLAWDVATTCTVPIPYKIYIATTTEPALSQMTWANFTDMATMVKEGSYTFDTAGWHTFLLDFPFNYSGSNLLVGVEANYGNGGTGYNNNPYFRYTSGASETHQWWRADYNAPTGLGTLNSSLPNLQMAIMPISDEPICVVNPASWDFGLQMVTDITNKAFTIANAGGGILDVVSIDPTSDGPFSIVESPTFPLSLATGESVNFILQYAPTAVGNHSATFTIGCIGGTTDVVVTGECYDPITYTYPFEDGFEEGQTNGSVLEVWTQILDGSTQYWRANSSETGNNRTPRNGAFNATLRYGGDTWMMRPFMMEAGTAYSVEVWARQDGDGTENASVGLYYATEADIDAMTAIIGQTGLTNGDYQQIVGGFVPQTSGIYWIAIHGVINWTPWYISIDDFKVGYPPTEPEFAYTPTAIEFGTVFANNPTDYQDVTVSNTAGGTLELLEANVNLVGDDAAMFEFDPVNLPMQLTVGQSATIPVRYNPSAVGVHNAILRMEFEGANYDVALSGNALGENALVEGFEGTLFPPAGWTVYNLGGSNQWFRGSAEPNSGSYHAQINWNTVAHDDWLISPKIAPTADNYIYSFYGQSYSDYDERFNVLVSTTDNEIASFTNVIATDVQTGANSYMLHNFDLQDFIGQEIYVAIQAISADQFRLFIDDVSGPDLVPVELTIVSAPYELAIYKDGVDTGEVTPHTFIGRPDALYGVYHVELAGYEFTPENYLFTGVADAVAEFNGYQIPDIEAGTDHDIAPGIVLNSSADLFIVDGVDADTPAIAALPNLDAENAIIMAYSGGDVDITLTYTITDPGTWYAMAYWGGNWHQGNPWPLEVPTETVVTLSGINLGAKGEVYVVLSRGQDPTVPVELSSFNAVLTAQNFVKLTWISQTETGMWGYRVYRGESDDQAAATLLTPTLIPATNTSTTQVYNLEDKEVEIGNTYWYWLEAVEINGSGMFYGQPASVTVVGEVPPVLPTVTTMGNAYPNPFKQMNNTTIDVSIKEGENGKVTVYNILGQVVKTFQLNEGFHKLNWDGKDARGNNCGSGVYFYKLSTPSTNMTKKMVIVK
ncbi:MAG: choice-of-anchor D domain-containing protein [Candidatus Cloacimonadaceae bacterium]|jgi:hypothetical protein